MTKWCYLIFITMKAGRTMNNEDKLIEAAEKLAYNTRGFEARTLERIGNRIKKTGHLNSADEKALKNMANIGKDIDEIYADLAETTGKNIVEMKQIMEGVMSEEVKQSQALYKATGTSFVPYGENAFAQQLVKNWSEQTAGEMINLSKTRAIGFVDDKGEFATLEGAFQSAMDEAVVAVRTGTTDFNTAMRDTIERLGGSGVQTWYGGGIHRSLESMVRQNLLCGAKQSAQQYQDYVGEQIGADGFEVDAHAGCRPSHEFMQGKVFSNNGDVKIDGVLYPDGAEALSALRDYGCLHFKTSFLLGISQPRYSQETLDKIQRETTEPIEYDGKTRTLYEWKQSQRALEREIRKEKNQSLMAKAAGNNTLAKQHSERVKVFTDKYNDLCEKTGITPTPERMAISGYKSTKPVKGIDNVNNKRYNVTTKGTNDKYRRFSSSDMEDYYEWEKTYHERMSHSLDKEDKKAVKEYSDGSCMAINGVERFEKGTPEYNKICKKFGVKDLDEYKEVSNNISNALNKLENVDDIVTHRYVDDVSYITGGGSNVDDIKSAIGKEYTEKGFMSSSIFEDKTVSFGGEDPIHIEIQVPKTARGGYINELSEKKNEEFEYLLDKNTKFRIIDGGEREKVTRKFDVKDKTYKEVYEKEKYIILEVIE